MIATSSGSTLFVNFMIFIFGGLRVNSETKVWMLVKVFPAYKMHLAPVCLLKTIFYHKGIVPYFFRYKTEFYFFLPDNSKNVDPS